MFNVYMDDLRPGPHNGYMDRECGWENWIIVRNAENVKKLLKLGVVDNLSLDHDMGYSSLNPNEENTNGKSLVLWMIDNNCWPKGNIAVHSANIVGAKEMEKLISDYRK